MLRRLGPFLLLAWLWVAPVPHVCAQAADEAQQDRASSFQAVTGGVKEDVPGGPLMLAAYAVVWIAVFGYVWRLIVLQRGVQANVERLERTVSSITPR